MYITQIINRLLSVLPHSEHSDVFNGLVARGHAVRTATTTMKDGNRRRILWQTGRQLMIKYQFGNSHAPAIDRIEAGNTTTRRVRCKLCISINTYISSSDNHYYLNIVTMSRPNVRAQPCAGIDGRATAAVAVRAPRSPGACAPDYRSAG